MLGVRETLKSLRESWNFLALPAGGMKTGAYPTCCSCRLHFTGCRHVARSTTWHSGLRALRSAEDKLTS
eukprot:11784156-Alexandrium_andersonii.AAC.1